MIYRNSLIALSLRMHWNSCHTLGRSVLKENAHHKIQFCLFTSSKKVLISRTFIPNFYSCTYIFIFETGFLLNKFGTKLLKFNVYDGKKAVTIVGHHWNWRIHFRKESVAGLHMQPWLFGANWKIKYWACFIEYPVVHAY